METAPLKSFATWARTTLIREVTARIAVVLAPASPDRVERPKAVEALEKAVTAAGGGDKGKAAIADRVAYTWFNRIIALRFMDANGYTGIGVVSPQPGVETGQPEILAEAKRGNIDAAVVGTKTRDTVTALLNGTRRSDDAQGEAYAMLLADYCRYWNRAMPFMFEREGDFTELLIPANLLADDSVSSRAVKVLTKDVCQDVEVIGWLYQFYISERKDEVFAGFKKNKKAGADEIPAATQLFTPHWIVRYLVENSLGRLWMLNRPSSHLVRQMQYYIAPVDEETDFLKIGNPEELKVIDPACGSGHMLTYAFDLLYAIYEEEGYAPAEIPGLILTNNLYGVEIDPRAGALAAFALTMKARAKQRTFFSKKIEPNVCVLEPISFTAQELDFLVTKSGDRHKEQEFWKKFEHADILGSLIRPGLLSVEQARLYLTAHTSGVEDDLVGNELGNRIGRFIEQSRYLADKYHVVIANPPYMGSRNMAPMLADYAKREFADSRSDLFAMFIERCIDLSIDSGIIAMITMQSWMFLSSYEDLRLRILNTSPPVAMAHLGDRAFDSIGGSVVATTAFVLMRQIGRSTPAAYFRLVDGDSEAEKERIANTCVSSSNSDNVFHVTAGAFAALPGSPIAYWVPIRVLDIIGRSQSISEVLQPRRGLFTTDNNLYLRYFWEVSWSRACVDAMSDEEALASGARWFAHNKGGANRKWFGNYEYVVDWEDLGYRIKASAAEKYPYLNGNINYVVHDEGFYFRSSISWSEISDAAPAFRAYDHGFTFNVKGMSAFPISETGGLPLYVLGFLNSPFVRELTFAINPTMSFGTKNFRSLPLPQFANPTIDSQVAELIGISRADWDSFETSWNFTANPLVLSEASSLELASKSVIDAWNDCTARARDLEEQVNTSILEELGINGELDPMVSPENVTLLRNPHYRYSRDLSTEDASAELNKEAIKELLSYAVGCMFGRYSLDHPGLILASQGDTLQDYFTRIPAPKFRPDRDNVIPIVDGDWFEDDIVVRLKEFLRVAFGEEYLQENLRFAAEAVGVKDLREYFVKSFYKDHVQRYKKRPIYWLFSSPKGSFNALIYMHRYTPSTVSTVLNEYLREFRAKLTASLQQQELLAAGGGTPHQQAAAQKEADRLRKVLLELAEYEHDVLYPLASRQLAIDLDDGVKANYPKFGAALKKIPGLEASDE
ncbi:BREX-1 system adenine-specific DNA-methyltransferase PglX [Amycolatopsis thermalba]|uniref:site-specific DNA-methyltransferase (adenine-specific) n=1 Tax=Amycolatopsis thermalba TaxID=944492 RepID=A0ABY4NS50_9PSEU|nr:MULTISPECIES: BREX-1 system adenine-specific DNA-methyltransferase PglX [Amycolatopsis]UQS22885.1 BREX-1 system adenine-specific DNA-methyltransferase PglX [Amycolatopsis thermalba]